MEETTEEIKEETRTTEVNQSVDEKETQPTVVVKKWCTFKNHFKQNCTNKRKGIVAGVVVLILLLAGGGYYYMKNKPVDVGAAAAKAKIEKLIGSDNAGVSVKGVTEESGLYKITIGIDKQPDQYAYVTKDGTKFIQQAVSFDEIDKQQAAQQQTAADASNPVEKTDKPTVDLYVMGFCPFGNQSEDTLKPVYDLLKSKVNFNFHYIVSSNGDTISSLHGPTEVVEDEVEACVLKNYGKDKWFSLVEYVNKNCGTATDTPCWETGAKSLSIVASKINNCVTAEGVALMKDNEKVSTAAGAQGSPTMLINGVSTKSVYQYGNSDVYKQAICDAFNTAPAECAKKLSTQASTTQGGSCGN